MYRSNSHCPSRLLHCSRGRGCAGDVGSRITMLFLRTSKQAANRLCPGQRLSDRLSQILASPAFTVVLKKAPILGILSKNHKCPPQFRGPHREGRQIEPKSSVFVPATSEPPALAPPPDLHIIRQPPSQLKTAEARSLVQGC